MAAITLMACYGMPPCAPNPDGGEDDYFCYDVPPPHCASAIPDGGGDGGLSDAGVWEPFCEAPGPVGDAGTDAGR